MGKLLDAFNQIPPELLQSVITEDEARRLGITLDPTGKHGDDESWSPIITRMDNISGEEIVWLWRGYIALRKLCLIEGDPSHGKTWLTLAIASAVSNGWPLPNPETGICIDEDQKEPANIIYMTAEDGLADTIKPRLVGLGADCNRIYVIEGQRRGDKKEPVTMQDIDILDKAMKQIKPSLIIVDPLQGFLGPKVDMHRANEVRPVMAGIMRLAESYNASFIIIRHLNKNNAGKAAYRGMGSIDFTASARTVLLVGKDSIDPNKRIVIPTKCNVGIEGKPISFMLTPEEGFRWAGKVDNTVEDLLYPEPKKMVAKDTKAIDDAVEFILDALDEGPKPIQKVKMDAKKAKINERTLRRAREQQGVKSHKEKETWYWYLPSYGEN